MYHVNYSHQHSPKYVRASFLQAEAKLFTIHFWQGSAGSALLCSMWHSTEWAQLGPGRLTSKMVHSQGADCQLGAQPCQLGAQPCQLKSGIPLLVDLSVDAWASSRCDG